MSGSTAEAFEVALKRRQRLFYRHPIGKIVHMPWRLSWSVLLRKWSLLRRRTVPVVARTFWGDPVSLQYPDAASVALHRYGFLEAGLTTFVLRTLRPGMTFFDIGAHMGYYTLLASTLVGPAGQVHCFEPSVNTYAVLSQNVRSRSNVKINPLAVSSQRATLQLSDYGCEFSMYNTLATGNLEHSVREKIKPVIRDVQAISVDEYVAESGARPHFIKVDAEGAESAILEGMKQTLEKIRPIISLEVGDLAEDRMSASRTILDRVLSGGYHAMEYEPTSGEIRPHILKDRYEHNNIFLVPD